MDAQPQNDLLIAQATSPFIDPVTKQKIFFVEKNPREAAIMAEKFNMDQLEECLGGHSTWHFDYMVYSTAMRCAELQHICFR